MEKIDIGKEFYSRLTNRDDKQRDGKYNGIEFRNKFLSGLYNDKAWKDDSVFIELDFSNVSKMGPSWANEVFAYFTKYGTPSKVLQKIKIVNISRVKRSIIEQELEAGYSKT